MALNFDNMKKLTIFLILSCCFSCTGKKTEFIQSKAIKNLFLVKNPKEYLPPRIGHLDFYKYSSNTQSFIEQERPGRYFREYIDYYAEDELATFIVSKCKNDTLKRVGRLYFYGLKGSENGQKEIDTLLYKCN
jgi:hypothetical protein